MAVFLLMQVAPRGREWSSLTGERRGRRRGGYIATTIYSLCLGSFCNEMACVMEALSKQWAYSTWRGVSVRTRLNTIPLIQGCSPSFFRSSFFTLSTVAITIFHFFLFVSLCPTDSLLSSLLFRCFLSCQPTERNV